MNTTTKLLTVRQLRIKIGEVLGATPASDTIRRAMERGMPYHMSRLHNRPEFDWDAVCAWLWPQGEDPESPENDARGRAEKELSA